MFAPRLRRRRSGEPLPEGGAPRRSRLGLKLLASAGLLGLVGVVGATGTMSSLNDTTANPANAFASGTVKIGDNDAGTALATFTNGRPGTTASGCELVSYTGTLPANVRLSAVTTGTGLGAYLDLVVTRGSFSGTPTAGSCTGFVADSTNYGNGAGIIYTGLLSSLGATAATGVLDPTTASPESWTTSETHAYKVQVTLRSDPLGQGKTASTTFTWTGENT